MTNKPAPTRFRLLLPLFLLVASGCSSAALAGAGLFAAGYVSYPLAHKYLLSSDSRKNTGEELPLPPKMEIVRGSVSSLERIALLPTYTLRLRILELGSGKEIAVQELGAIQSFPTFFSMEYDVHKFEAGKTYALVAELRARGTTLFATDTQYRVNELEKDSELNLVLVRHIPSP